MTTLSKQQAAEILGERLRAKIAQRHWRISHLADALGVGTPVVYPWLRGRSVPHGRYLRRLADVLGTTTDYLLGRT